MSVSALEFERDAWADALVRRLSAAAVAAQEAPISVIVCTRNRPAELDGCLEALAAQDYAAYDVVVIDNGSTGELTRLTAERRSVRYVREPRRGLDWARNRGLHEASGAIVAYTDDDARPDPGWLAAIASGFASPDVQAVTGRVVAATLETDAQHLFEDVYGGMDKGDAMRVYCCRGGRIVYRPERYGAGCNMAFRRGALERLGGFDPALDVGTATGGGGDLDVLQRVIEADGPVVYRPDALVRHFHRRTRRQLRRQLFDNGRAYSAVLTASLLRARGADRLRVVARYWAWIWYWHVRRLARRLVRREQLPLSLILAELGGVPLGPVLYSRACRRARRIAREGLA